MRNLKEPLSKPSGAILDAQVAGTVGPQSRDHDAGHKSNWKKQHTIVDTSGLLFIVAIIAASLQDRDGPRMITKEKTSRDNYTNATCRGLAAAGSRTGTKYRTTRSYHASPSKDNIITLCAMKLTWSDSGYARKFVERARQLFGFTVEIAGRRGFRGPPPQRIVKRRFPWIIKYRKLDLDYQYHIVPSESMVTSAMLPLMFRHLPRKVPGCEVTGYNLQESAGLSVTISVSILFPEAMLAVWCTRKELRFDGQCDQYVTTWSSNVLVYRHEASRVREHLAEYNNRDCFRLLIIPSYRSVSAECNLENHISLSNYIDCLWANHHSLISKDISLYNVVRDQAVSSARNHEIGYCNELSCAVPCLIIRALLRVDNATGMRWPLLRCATRNSRRYAPTQ